MSKLPLKIFSLHCRMVFNLGYKYIYIYIYIYIYCLHLWKKWKWSFLKIDANVLHLFSQFHPFQDIHSFWTQTKWHSTWRQKYASELFSITQPVQTDPLTKIPPPIMFSVVKGSRIVTPKYDHRSSGHDTPKYATLIYWLVWAVGTWKTANTGRGCLWIPLICLKTHPPKGPQLP